MSRLFLLGVQYIIYLLNQQMSDEEVAFDDWEAEAEAVVEQVKNEPKEEEAVETKQQQAVEGQKQKVEVVDPRILLLSRIAQYRSLQGDKYDDYLENIKGQSTNTEIKGSNQILKNDKDFAQFAKSVGKRLDDQTTEEELENLDENHVFEFVQELVFLLYGQTEWKNLQGVKQKLKIVKKERKDEEIRAKKQKQKEQRMKKQQKALELQESKKPKKEEPKIEEDIFDGATFVNSKQLEDELKNKQKAKVEVKPAVVEDDDDDFM